ncbi:subtilisin-like protein [Lactarius quietus]|nr:subtilisin-like protein [Lactarius quietus]
MRYHPFSVTTLFFALRSLAKQLSPPWDDMRIHHSWDNVPTDWEDYGHPPSDTTITLYVALQSHHENALIDALYEVSDPEHSRYGKHLSKEQVAELVAPHPETLEVVNSWLEHHEIPSSNVSLTHGGNTLTLKGVSVTQANIILGASYRLYRHIFTNQTIVRTVGYALPAVLHKHVLTVAPTTSFNAPTPRFQGPHNSSGGAAGGQVKSEAGGPAPVISNRKTLSYITTPFLRWLYHTNAYVPSVQNKNSVGVLGCLGDSPNPSDLTAYMRKNRIDGLGATYDVVKIGDGVYDPSNPHTEANFDIQCVESMAYPIPVTFYSAGTNPYDPNDMFLPWLAEILEDDEIPQTITISYFSDELSCGPSYAVYVCNLFGQLGSRGVSVLFASGDDGVGPGNCVRRDGSVRFKPKFPPTCPFVTTVGGTTNYEEEVGAIISGGGFSNYFGIPRYQLQAVPPFLRTIGNTYQGLYNRDGRGVPDISAQAIGYRIILNGQQIMVHGTSGSSPTTAAIIAMLNDYRISKGQPSLGFLNVWLYGTGRAALNDIKRGTNPGCNTPGFSAAPGWDPVTGLGTPDFPELQARLPAVASSGSVTSGTNIGT